jgi:hypothetical protein
MAVTAAWTGAVNDHGMVEQAPIAILDFQHFTQEERKHFDMMLVDFLQALYLRGLVEACGEEWLQRFALCGAARRCGDGEGAACRDSRSPVHIGGRLHAGRTMWRGSCWLTADRRYVLA